MRTNIEIDDDLMGFVMATGDFKTKREAVEAGLRLIQRRKAYAEIRAARGTLNWDDSDEAWATYRAQQAQDAASSKSNPIPDDQADQVLELAVHEQPATYAVKAKRVAP